MDFLFPRPAFAPTISKLPRFLQLIDFKQHGLHALGIESESGVMGGGLVQYGSPHSNYSL